MGNEKSRPSGASSKLPAALGGKRGPSVNELVQRAQRTGVLNLSNSALKEIPMSLVELSRLLRTLDLSSNRILSLPPFIGDFAALKSLNLDGNRISQLPDEMGHLKKLETLSLNGNQLSTLPDSLISCTSLKTVNLAENAVRSFPTPLSHLPALEMVDLTGNNLTGLPDTIGDCRAVELNFNRNQLSTLNASALSKCPRLKMIELTENNLTELPDTLNKCLRLKVLRVEENCLALTEFTEELLGGSTVSLLAVNGNLFQEKDLHQQPGWEAFQERYTQSRKKLY